MVFYETTYILHSALMSTFPTPGEILSGHIGPDPLGLINILPEVEDQTTLVTVGIQLFGAKIAEVMIASSILLVAMVGAIHITLENIKNYNHLIPKDVAIYVICQNGARSLAAINLLKTEFNYKNLINVKGGIQ